MSNQNLNQIVSHFLLVCLTLHGCLIPLHHQPNGDHYIIFASITEPLGTFHDNANQASAILHIVSM